MAGIKGWVEKQCARVLQRLVQRGAHRPAHHPRHRLGYPAAVAGLRGKRLYVWFEAVIGYLSASIEWANDAGRPEAWKAWWYDPAALTYYFIGKDNVVFHAILFPMMLMRAGGYILPDAIPANEIVIPTVLMLTVLAHNLAGIGAGAFHDAAASHRRDAALGPHADLRATARGPDGPGPVES
jgi:hypothetical protein